MHRSIYTFKEVFQLKTDKKNLNNKCKILQNHLKVLLQENSKLKRENFILTHEKYHPYYKIIDSYIEKFKYFDKTLSPFFEKIPTNEIYFDWTTSRIILMEIADKLHEFHIQFCLIPFSNDIKQIEKILNHNNMVSNNKYMSFLFFTINDFSKALDNGWLDLFYTDTYNKKEVVFIHNIISKYIKCDKKNDILSIKLYNF